MDSLVVRLSPVLHLTRITHAVAAIANVWFVLLWTRAMEPGTIPAGSRVVSAELPIVLAVGGVMGLALFVFAMVVHDAFDERRDRVLRTHRPLASGAISHSGAVTIAAFSLFGAVLSASWIGGYAIIMVCAVGAGAVVYHALLRTLASVGLVIVGLIYAGHMLTPNPALGFLWPVVWAMTHALLVGLMAHRLSDRRPVLDARALWLAGIGWGSWAALFIVVGARRSGRWWPDDLPLWTLLVQGLLIAGFVLIAWRKSVATRSRVRGSEKVRRYGALWQPLYGVVWCAGAALWNEALILALLAGVGFLMLTFLREIYSLVEQPVGYRR